MAMLLYVSLPSTPLSNEIRYQHICAQIYVYSFLHSPSRAGFLARTLPPLTEPLHSCFPQFVLTVTSGLDVVSA